VRSEASPVRGGRLPTKTEPGGSASSSGADIGARPWEGPGGGSEAPERADLRPHVSRVLADALFTCPARAAAGALAAARAAGARAAPVFSFLYDHALGAGEAAWGPRYPACWRAACHGADLLALFRADLALVGAGRSAGEERLTRQMWRAWGAFLARGAPGALEEGEEGGGAGEQEARWPAYSMRKRLTMRLALGEAKAGGGKGGAERGGALLDDYRGKRCTRVWDKHGYEFGE